VPDIPGLDSVDWLDNRRILELDSVPDHLVIIGGSYIGLEFGQMFRRFGAEVTIIERAPRIIDREDPDISDGVQSILEDEGIAFVLNAEVDRVASASDGSIEVTATVREDSADTTRTIAGSHLLIGAGRVPNTDRLDPGAGQIETDDRGYLIVDERLRTNVDGVYALGDVNTQPGAFTHTAVNDAEIVLSQLFDGDVPGGKRTVEDRTTTYALFTDPPLGRVGLTEQQALEQGINLLKATRPMSRISRAREMGETKGFVKLLVDADTDQIVGAAILGVNGDEIINMFTAFMHSGLPCTKYRSVVLAHPTVSELMPWILDDLAPVDAS
jgi:pyruvate/2-oxoglutarate dehydrogenase complex dihydrolipoamide dehydrogenase (E3) component